MVEINSYAFLEELGHGLSGIVYKSKDLIHRFKTSFKTTQVAIKVVEFTPDEDKDYRLREEIRIMKKCAHVNIAGYLESFDGHGKTFIVMELCDTTLYKYFMEKTVLRQDEAVFFIYQILCALKYLHSTLKIVHRDIKLSNVLLKFNSDQKMAPVVKLCDFGLAASLGDHPDNEQLTYCGTPNYMAPEVAQNRGQSFARDMWSVGVMFYFLVTGNAPFAQGTKEETINAAVRGVYADDDRISVEGRDFLRKLLQVNPEQRLTAEQAQDHYIFERFKVPKSLTLESSSISSRRSNISYGSQTHTSYSTPTRYDFTLPSTKRHPKNVDHSSPTASASSNVATPIASYNNNASLPRQGMAFNDTSSSSYSHPTTTISTSHSLRAGQRTENLYGDNGKRISGEWVHLGHPSAGLDSMTRSSHSGTVSSRSSGSYGSGSGRSARSPSRVNRGNRISIDQLPKMFSEEIILDVVEQEEEPVAEERSLNSYDVTAALLGLSNEDTINSRSELSSVDVARRLNYSESNNADNLRGPYYHAHELRANKLQGRGNAASRRYQSEVSEYGSDEDVSRMLHPAPVPVAAAPPLLIIQRGGHTQYVNSSGTYYDDGAIAALDEVETSSAVFDLREEFNQPLPVIHNDKEYELEEPIVPEQVSLAVEELEIPLVTEPTDEQMQLYDQLRQVAETIQAKRFLLQPLVFATVDQELMMISAPLPTGKVVDVGGCVGDLFYCVPVSSPAAEEEGAAGTMLGLFVTAEFHEADGTNETILCQKILSKEEVELYKELYAMQDSSNCVVAQDPDPLVNSLYFQNRIVDCDWKSHYNGTNCPLLDSEMWLSHRVTPTILSSSSLPQVQTSLNRLYTLVDALGAVVNRIIVKYRPDADQKTSATKRLERIKAEFTLMSNDGVRPMFRMRWTNGMNLAGNLATNKLAFLRTKRPLLPDGITRSDSEVETEEWSGICSLHHCDYPDLPAGLPADLPSNLVKYVMMAISAVGMCLHEVRAKECAVKDCELLNGNVRLLVCTKFDEIY